MSMLSELQSEFTAKGIPFAAPGFYDHPNFLREEQRDSDYLGKYAEFVFNQNYPAEYLSQAREKIDSLTAHLLAELKKDGRTGACVDVSMALGRMLERLGIWNVMIKGALTMTFEPSSGLPDVHFQPLMATGNPALAGHVWIVAPPFKVVDITAKFQPYTRGQNAVLPERLMIEKLTPVSYDEVDLAERAARETLERRLKRKVTLNDLLSSVRGLEQRISKLGCGSATLSGVNFKYVSCAASAGDGTLEQMKNLRLNGKYPAQIYSEYLGSNSHK